ncbi:MAG: hypothetical protein INR69_16255 [Mucilaginibacter polytrichastri]|nr:hypothetical protein [Mucilaginibacter polytrichastri]
MDELADKKLAQRFRDVFDEHTDDGAAEGWAKLQQQRKPKRRPVPLAWISGAAAVLLLTFALGWYLGNHTETEKAQLAKKKNTPQQKMEGENGMAEPETSSADPVIPEKPALAASGESLKSDPLPDVAPDRKLANAASGGAFLTAQNRVPRQKASTYAETTVLAARLFHPSFSVVPVTGDVRMQNIIVQNLPAKSWSVQNMPASASEDKRIRKQSGNGRPVFSLAVFAGPQLNYGRQNTRRQALPSGGVQGELALGRHFSVGFGAGVSDYQLAYNNGLPPVIGNPSPIADAAPVSNMLSNATAAASSPTKRTPSFVKTGVRQVNSDRQSYMLTSASNVQISTVNARFTAIEMPLSFSWKPQMKTKPALSLTAALNSTWMIREEYVADFTVQNPNGRQPVSIDPERSEDSFTGFTPFSSMQFSLGVQPGGANSRFSVEPFARFPLQNQGIEQLRYGAAGLNLKFRLTGKYKKTD